MPGSDAQPVPRALGRLVPPRGHELPTKGMGSVCCHAPWSPQNPAEGQAIVESIGKLLHGQPLETELGNAHVHNNVFFS